MSKPSVLPKRNVWLDTSPFRPIPAELGRAVEHAGLSSHKQVPHPSGGKRRKDFDDRVRDQGSPLRSDRIATISSIRAIVATASDDTILSTNLRHPQPRGFDRVANHQSRPYIAPGTNCSSGIIAAYRRLARDFGDQTFSLQCFAACEKS